MTIAIVGNGEGKYPAVLDETGLFVDSPIQFGPAPPLGLGSLLGGQVNAPGTGDTWKCVCQADFRGGAGQLRQLDLSRFMYSVGVMPVDDMDTRLKLRIVEDDDSAISWPGMVWHNWYDYLQIGTTQTWMAVKLVDAPYGAEDWRLIMVSADPTTEDASLSGHACEGKMCLYGWRGTTGLTFAKWLSIGSWTDFANQPPWTGDSSRKSCKPVYWDGKVWQFNGYSVADPFKYCWTSDEGATAWSGLQSLEGRGQLQRVVPYARQLLLCWEDRLDGFAGKQYLIEEFPTQSNAINFMLAVVYQGVFYFNVGDSIMAYSGTMREIVRPQPPFLLWNQIVGGCAYQGKLYFATSGISRGLYCCDLASGAVYRIHEKVGGWLYYLGMTCLGDLKFVEYDSSSGNQLYHIEPDKMVGSGNEMYSTTTGQLYLSWADAGYPELRKVWGYVCLDCKVPFNCTLTVKYSLDGNYPFTTLGSISGSFDGHRVMAFPAGVVAERVQFLVEFATTDEWWTPILRQLVYGVALAPDNKHRLAAAVMATDDIAGAAAAGYGEQVIRLLEDRARRVVDFDWLGPRAVQLYNGATYSDQLAHATTENAPGGTDYVTLSGATTSWALYVLSMIPFGVIKVWMETVNSNAAVLDLEYYNGSTWVDVPRFTDGTASGGATLAQDGDIVVDEIPDDMALVTVNGQTGFGYRLKWSATLDPESWIDVIQIACRYFLELENAMLEVGLGETERLYEGRIPITLTEV